MLRDAAIGKDGMITAQYNQLFGPWYVEFDGMHIECGVAAYRDLQRFMVTWNQIENN